MRWYGWVVGLLCASCATPGRGPGTTVDDDEGVGPPPKEETVYLVPAADAMMVARQILEEQRYDVLEREDGLEMFSSAHQPGFNHPGSRSFERYYVKATPLAPRQTVVRVFRLVYSEQEDLVETRMRGIGSRDRELLLAEEAHPFDANKTYKSAPNMQGNRLMDLDDPFKDAPGMERFRMVRGARDLEIERKLLQRLEMVPSLEMVGGNTSVPARSLVLKGWSEPGEQTQSPPAECGAPLEGVEALLAKGHTLLLADPL
ncbi:hypothetical protein ACLESO_51600, partial [Pyxidicoccus sp. 3LG]